MSTNVLMPALSPTMTEGNLVKWNVKEGDTVRSGDVLAEIETDKATMEVEAVEEGVIGRIVVPEGTQGVQVNSVIAVLLDEGESAPSASGPPPDAPQVARDDQNAGGSTARPAEAVAARTEAPQASPAPKTETGSAQATPLAARMAQQAGLDLTGVNGSGPHGKITKSDVEAALGRAPGSPGPGSRSSVAAPSGGRVFASPLARKLARDAGIELGGIAGSGPQGRIIARDVETAVGQPRAPAAPAQPSAPTVAAPPPGPTMRPDIPGMPAFELVPHTSMRKVIARRLTESKQTVPHFYLTVDCEVDQLLRMRQEVNEQAGEKGVRISVNDFVIKACALALRGVPDANASWSEEGVRRWQAVDISVAVAIPGGLITPIIRNADQKGLAAISVEMKDLAARARDGKLKPEEFQGGTFSISNLGMFGIRQFDAVINPPQACILAIGASEPRPVVKNGQLAVATVMTCTLSCDHRVVDGALGSQLLGAFKVLVERPAMMLL